MPTENKKPISELNAGEVYLRFLACKGPDDTEYEKLYRKLEELLYGKAVGHAWKVLGGENGNKQHGELVIHSVQDAFLKINRQQRRDRNQRTGEELARWSPEGNQDGTRAMFTTYFLNMVGNFVRDKLRREKKQQKLHKKATEEASADEKRNGIRATDAEKAGDPIVSIIAAETAAILKGCFDALQDPFRKVMVMIFYEHRSQTEIAESIGANNTAVSRWKKNGIESLKECVGAADPELFETFNKKTA